MIGQKLKASQSNHLFQISFKGQKLIRKLKERIQFFTIADTQP